MVLISGLRDPKSELIPPRARLQCPTYVLPIKPFQLNPITMKTDAKTPNVKLIVSDEERPMIRLQPGLHVRVEEFGLLDENLEIPKIGARLCGGSGTCLALIDIDTKPNSVL